MNVALIFAGGSGTRMNSKTTPKQFLKLNGKEIIIYTIEHFEQHNEVDAIIVVCLASWISYLKTILNKHSIKKVKWIVEGGSTGQKSIYEGLKKLKQECEDDTIILVHDGVRPLIDDKVISDNIISVKRFGSAITTAPSVETIVTVNEERDVNGISDRSKSMMAKAPQSFYLGQLLKVHEMAKGEEKDNFIDTASIMNYYGYPLKTVEGGYENIKITTPSDYYIFKTIIEIKENAQIFGI